MTEKIKRAALRAETTPDELQMLKYMYELVRLEVSETGNIDRLEKETRETNPEPRANNLISIYRLIYKAL